MTLQKGPEADRRYPHPKIDNLPGFDVKWLLKLYASPDCAIFVGNISSRTPVTENAVLADDHISLSNAYKQKQPRRDVEIHAGKGFLRRQVSPDRISSERG
jgi:hypothetical protein